MIELRHKGKPTSSAFHILSGHPIQKLLKLQKPGLHCFWCTVSSSSQVEMLSKSSWWHHINNHHHFLPGLPWVNHSYHLWIYYLQQLFHTPVSTSPFSKPFTEEYSKRCSSPHFMKKPDACALTPMQHASSTNFWSISPLNKAVFLIRNWVCPGYGGMDPLPYTLFSHCTLACQTHHWHSSLREKRGPVSATIFLIGDTSGSLWNGWYEPFLRH